MMNQVKYSIIIPCYNVADFIDATIGSLLQVINTRVDTEVVLVNDGSKDSTLEKIEAYNNQKNIKILSKENGGVSSARNAGIEIATGMYVLFLDADDKYGADIFECLDRVAMKKEVIFFGYQTVNFKTGVKRDYFPLTSEHVNEPSLLDAFLSKKSYLNICAAAFNRNFINEKNIKFNTKHSHCEDLEFIIWCLLKGNEFAVIDKVMFFYLQRDGSAVNRPVGKGQIEKLAIFKSFYHYLNTVEKNQCLAGKMNFYHLTIYLLLYYSIFSWGVKEKEIYHKLDEGFAFFRQHKIIFPEHSYGKKVKIIYKLIRCFSPKIISFPLRALRVFK